MSILPKLISLYRGAGYEPVTGHNPLHFGGWGDAPFTRFVKDNAVHGIAGLALQEIMFLEGLAGCMAPKRILVIGNAFGWSTIALALIFPDAVVVALDPGEEGNMVTRAVAAAGGLRITVETGYSPQGVAAQCVPGLGGPADLILIDAVHTNEAVLTDFAACLPLIHDETVVLFHDVVNWGMIDAFNQIRRDNQLEGHVLTRTPSGMAVVWRRASAALRDYVAVFTDDPQLLPRYRVSMLRTHGKAAAENDQYAAALSQL